MDILKTLISERPPLLIDDYGYSLESRFAVIGIKKNTMACTPCKATISLSSDRFPCSNLQNLVLFGEQDNAEGLLPRVLFSLAHMNVTILWRTQGISR